MKKNILLIFALALAFGLPNAALAQQKNISGKLTPTVEAGGWLIIENSAKYLLLNAGKFRNESWFKEGTAVFATGEIKSGVMTIYQEGTPFEAQSLRPLQNNSSGNSISGNNENVTRLTVSGSSKVLAQPDTAIISVAVVTQNTSAVQAQQQNAVKTTAVLDALKIAAGSGAEIKTSGYSLVPQRVYKENQPPTITGYEARNTVTVTLSDLNRVGAVIDASGKAGANNIDGISFTLRNDRDVRGRALTEAAREALGKAKILAQSLGGRLIRVTSISEGGTTPRPVLYAQRESLAQSADTPIEIGNLEINSSVELIAEIEIGANQY